LDGEPARLASVPLIPKFVSERAARTYELRNRGTSAALNTDGAARHGLRVLRHPPIRKVNRSGDRHRLESDWVARHCGSRPRPSSTGMLNQSGLWRPFEAGRHLTVWRSTRQASAIHHSADRGCTGSKRVSSSLAAFARVGRLGTHAVSYTAIARCNPGARNHSGKCHKDRLVPSPRCKRGPYGQEVRFRPLPTMRP